MGRPATGHKPIRSVRIEPDAMKRAFEHAKADGKALGQWLEEAIQEKIDREANDGERG